MKSTKTTAPKMSKSDTKEPVKKVKEIKDDKKHNSVGPKTGKKDGKSGKK